MSSHRCKDIYSISMVTTKRTRKCKADKVMEGKMKKKISPKDGKKGEIKEQNLDETSRKQRTKWQI